MALDPTYARKVEDGLRAKLSGMWPRCPLCGEDNWNIEELSHLPLVGVSIPPGHPPIAGRVLYVVPLTCTKCAHVLHFSARELGV
jgi:hypothetical protein